MLKNAKWILKGTFEFEIDNLIFFNNKLYQKGKNDN